MELLNKPDPIKKKARAKATAADEATPPPSNGYIEDLLFWKEFKKIDKESGKEYIEYRFSYNKFPYFLANNGFRKIKMGENGFQYVRLVENKLIALEPYEIHEFVLAYIAKGMKPQESGIYTENSLKEDKMAGVSEMFSRGGARYANPVVYLGIPQYTPRWLKDDKHTSYQYFSNGYVKITKDTCEFHEYKEMSANVWTKTITDFEITLSQNLESTAKRSIAYKFLQLALCGGSDNADGQDDFRLQSLIITIGYLVDTYKDYTLTKTPVFADKKPNISGNEAHGGSGKSIVAKMIKRMVNTYMMDGKAFKFEDPWAFEPIRADHKLIIFNDVKKKFQFDLLFAKITEDFEISKKYAAKMLIPYEESPKMVVITNYSLAGTGNAFDRRQQYIEFSDYFGEQHTPYKEFGHTLFADWGKDMEVGMEGATTNLKDEWNLFNNFRCYCVQQFKKYFAEHHQLMPFPEVNQKYNKLLADSGQEFIDYMDMQLIDDNPLHPGIDTAEGAELDKDLIFKGLKDTYPNTYDWMKSTNKVTGWVKMWAEMRKLKIHPKKSDKKYSMVFTRKK